MASNLRAREAPSRSILAARMLIFLEHPGFSTDSKRVCVASHVTPKLHRKFVESERPRGLLIIWVGKLGRHLSL